MIFLRKKNVLYTQDTFLSTSQKRKLGNSSQMKVEDAMMAFLI